jgi:tetratricopeptide (TPR) repeat protein
MAAQTERALARARERFAVQDYYGTVHLLEEIVAAGRAFADVHHLLGVSLSLLGQRERALTELTRALELNPRYLEALIHLGLVLSELGREAEAEDAFRRAASSVAPPSDGLPAPGASRLANQHAELAEAYAEAGALDRAVEQYQRALELGPGFVDLRYRMARLLLEAGRSLEARESLEEVLRLRPNFVDASAALGLAHFLSGDALGARDIWKACLSRRPENARVEAYLAMLGRAGS